MLIPQVIVNEERESLPRAIALKVEVFLTTKDEISSSADFRRNLESSLSYLIDAHVSVAVAVSTSNIYSVILSELGNVSTTFADILMIEAAEVVAIDFGVVGMVEVKYGPLRIELNFLEKRGR